jgi:hypothetical protein
MKKAGDLPLHGRSDEHGCRFGRGLNWRRDIGRLAEHLPRRINDGSAGFDSDTGA